MKKYNLLCKQITADETGPVKGKMGRQKGLVLSYEYEYDEITLNAEKAGYIRGLQLVILRPGVHPGEVF